MSELITDQRAQVQSIDGSTRTVRQPIKHRGVGQQEARDGDFLSVGASGVAT